MRRAAAFSDIHGNVEALDAVLADIDRCGIGDLWCLGDVVGNGHDPVGCLDRVEERCSVVLAGNHEAAIVGRKQLPPAAAYSRSALADAGRLERLRQRSSEWTDGTILLAHGCPAPFDPVRDYLLEDVTPDEVFDSCLQAELILVGHTHQAGTWRRGRRRLVNVGSVGEPRDRDGRPTWFEIAWSEAGVSSVHERRVQFDRQRYVNNMASAGLDLPPMWGAGVDVGGDLDRYRVGPRERA